MVDEQKFPTEDEELTSYSFESKAEGIKRLTYATRYERNPTNRRNAIRIHGTVCQACGFDFEKTYGEIGKDHIEVHHVKPLRNDMNIISSISVTDIVFDDYFGKWNYRAIPKVKTWSYFLTIP